MGLGKVTAVERKDDGLQVRVDQGGDDIVAADHLGASGDDSPPLPGDTAGTTPAPGAGGEQIVGYYDPKNASKAKDGEKRFYSRDPDGNLVAEVWLKGDGTIVVEFDKGAGKIEHLAGGKVKADIAELECTGDLKVGGKVTAGGTIEAGGEITWNAGTVPTKASTHLHNTALGPSSPPTPGT